MKLVSDTACSFLLLACATACSAETAPANRDATHEPATTPPTAAAPPASSGVAAPAAPEDLLLPHAGTLPLGPADVLRLSDGDAIDLATAIFPQKDGSVVVVFDRFDAPFTRSSLLTARSSHGQAFTKPAPLARGASAFVAGPSALLHAGASFLYHEEAATPQSRPSLWRSALRADGTWDAAQKLPAVADFTSLTSWPEVTAMGTGALLAFRGGPRAACRVATSRDGVTFTPRTAPCTEPAAMAASATFANGTLAFAHQNGDPANMISYVLTSSDAGVTWSPPLAVSNAVNVHDTSFVARQDGGIDLYFIYPPDEHGFSLFRRALSPTGALGLEQRVTQSLLGEPSKPHVARLADGKLLLAYAEIAERGPSREPSVQRIVLASLTSDAPAP